MSHIIFQPGKLILKKEIAGKDAEVKGVVDVVKDIAVMMATAARNINTFCQIKNTKTEIAIHQCEKTCGNRLKH